MGAGGVLGTVYLEFWGRYTELEFCRVLVLEFWGRYTELVEFWGRYTELTHSFRPQRQETYLQVDAVTQG